MGLTVHRQHNLPVDFQRGLDVPAPSLGGKNWRHRERLPAISKGRQKPHLGPSHQKIEGSQD